MQNIFIFRRPPNVAGSRLELNPNVLFLVSLKKKKNAFLRAIIEAETFEHFLQTRFVGQKRFSLEGGETLIACLESILERSEKKIKWMRSSWEWHTEVASTCSRTFSGNPSIIFSMNSQKIMFPMQFSDGDVRYHLGFETRRKASNGHRNSNYD